MKKYNAEEVKAITGTIRKTMRSTHKPATVELDDGRYITSSAMGVPYTLHAADGNVIGRASTGDQLIELLNETDGGLYRAWASSSDKARELAIDIRRVEGGRDQLRAMADRLAAKGRPGMLALEDLDKEARRILRRWEMDQITPEAARSLAELEKLPHPPAVQFLMSFGPEDISDILSTWVAFNPGQTAIDWDISY